MADRTYIKVSMKETYQVIELIGRLTYDEINTYRDEVKKAIKEADGYIINLGGVEQIDSTGMGLMVNIAKQFITNKKKMVIVVKDDLIRELFIMSKLDKVFTMVDTVDIALGELNNEDDTYWSKVTGY